jgi:hypothetical protein
MEIALILGLTMLVVWLAVGLAVAVIGVVGCLREASPQSSGPRKQPPKPKTPQTQVSK